MLRHSLITLFLFTQVPAHAQQITPPANLFKDPKFIRDFVGSYGFLSDVEPKVSADEQQLLVRVQALFEKSQFRAAEQEVTRFIQETERPTERDKPPGEISPAMIFVLGNLYFQANRPEEARRAFEDAIKRFPRFRRAHTNLAYLHVSRDRMDEALPMLQKAVELGENSSRVYGLMGYCHMLKKNPLAAENAYRQAYLLDPVSRDWKLGLAQALMAQDKFAESATLLGSLIEENPNDKQLWLQQTNAYLAMDRKEDAAVNLEVLRLKNLADESNLTLLGNLYMDRAEPMLALQAYLAAIDKTPKLDVPRSLKSAKILTDYGFPDQAAEFLSRVRSKAGDALPQPDRVALLLAEARVADAREERETARNILDELIAIAPADGEVLLEYARHLDAGARAEETAESRAELVQEARTHYQLAARSDVSAYPANLGLGQMLVREQRFIEGLAPLESALAVKKSESLQQYVSRVRRAADRQKLREDRAEE